MHAQMKCHLQSVCLETGLLGGQLPWCPCSAALSPCEVQPLQLSLACGPPAAAAVLPPHHLQQSQVGLHSS